MTRTVNHKLRLETSTEMRTDKNTLASSHRKSASATDAENYIRGMTDDELKAEIIRVREEINSANAQSQWPEPD